jgi:hypothetical protein
MDGFDIKGEWINKNTGQKVLIRDAIMGENGMDIITATGDILNVDDFSKNYMQASNEVYDENGQQIGVEELSSEDLGINGEVKEISLGQDYKNNLFAVFGGESNNKSTYNKPKEQKIEKVKTSKNYDIIKKFFDKFDTNIDIDLTITWTDIPKEGLKTLIDYLDVSKEEISEYIYDNYLNKDKVKEILNNKVSDLLS